MTPGIAQARLPKGERGSLRGMGCVFGWTQPCISAGYPPRYGGFWLVVASGPFRVRSGAAPVLFWESFWDPFGSHFGVSSGAAPVLEFERELQLEFELKPELKLELELELELEFELELELELELDLERCKLEPELELEPFLQK